MARKLETPFLVFYDKNGVPLNNGKIWFGVANLNAETNPIVIYWDKAGTIVANQPINTLNGFPVRNGIISRLYINVDSYSYTIRNQNNAIVDGSLIAYSDNFARTGDTANGAFTFDTTNTFGTANQQYPFKIQHSNIYTNLDPYGSGTVLIDATGQDNNQPLFITRKKISNSSFGNGANCVFQNLGGVYVNTDILPVDLEFVGNNSLVNTYNGKAETGTQSGSTSFAPTDRRYNGLYYIASRRGPQHPSGANTGFERQVNFYTLTMGGEIESLGNGLSITPTYDFSAFAYVDINSAFNDARFKANSTFVGGDAYLDLFSGSAGSATIGGHWRLFASGSDDRLSVRNMSAGGITAFEVLRADASNRGITSFYHYTDTTRGAIRLGNSTNGHIIDAQNKTYDFQSTGVTNITTDSLYYVSAKQILKINANITGAGLTTNLSPLANKMTAYINVIANSGTYTITFPASMVNSQEFIIIPNGNVTTVVFTALEVGGTIMDAPTAFTANVSVIFQYYAADKILLRIK